MTKVVKWLIVTNTILFIGSYLVPEVQVYFPMYFFENPLFKFWQPLTSMFMHGGISHLFFNMFALYMFGSYLEQPWGDKKFLFFYISCGFGAVLLHQGVSYMTFQSAYHTLVENGFTKPEIQTLLENGSVNIRNIIHNTTEVQNTIDTLVGTYRTAAVGASGAIYGVLVAFASMYPNTKLLLMFIPVPIKAKYFVPGILLIDLISGLNGGVILGASTGIAHFAHLGGALTGFIMMWYWKRK